MANLDNHPNLVNMLASCTSQIGNGKLWLLLEFCPHGDLKNFLIKHRKSKGRFLTIELFARAKWQGDLTILTIQSNYSNYSI